MTAETRATVWNFAQAFAVALTLAAALLAARLHASAGIPYPDPCRVCLTVSPEWLCWLQGCW